MSIHVPSEHLNSLDASHLLCAIYNQHVKQIISKKKGDINGQKKYKIKAKKAPDIHCPI